MTRAYQPRPATRDLVRKIEAIEGVAGVRIIAPHRGTNPTPARLLVTLEPRNPSHPPVRTIFSLSEARQWLGYER